MDDALLASRAAAGDLDSFGQLYDRYFGRVYDFAWRTLGDELEAAAATEDAFGRAVVALQHPGNAPTFRGLLFSSAHEAVLARADGPADGRTGPAYEEAFGAFEVPDPSRVENAAVVRGDYELASLGWEALASLTARDYALLDLHLRQGLGPHEIAHVLGTNKKEAETILKRMTKAASDAIDSYVIARKGVCPRLREELSPFPIPPLDEEARTVAQRHVASCEVCAQEKLRLPNLFEVFAAFTAIAALTGLKSPWLREHSTGVAELAEAAAWRLGLPADSVTLLRRAALAHDLGRIGVSNAIWEKPGALGFGEWERVRLHPHFTERAFAQSPALAPIGILAGSHHERLDGSGYHRGAAGPELAFPARLLAAADAYRAMTEPRPHREPHPSERAAQVLAEEASAGRLDPDAVAAVLEAAGQRAPRLERPAGLTEREAEVLAMVARGLQTKQVARALGISLKTADRHIQNAYRKIGVSSRAAATMFAMEHGLVAWGELPIARPAARS